MLTESMLVDLWAGDYRRRLQRSIQRSIQQHCGGDADLAEDLLAETYARAWAARAAWRPMPDHPSPEGWIWRIAQNLVRDHYKSSRVRQVSWWPVETGGDVDKFGEARRCLTAELAIDTVIAAVDVEAGRSQAEQLLTRLPPGQRIVVRLRAAGWSHREIARCLGITLGASKARMLRAISYYRSEWEGPL